MLQEKGKETSAAAISYKDLVSRKDELFDMSATDLEDQRSSMKMECNKVVDPISYMTTMKEQRRKEREEEYRRQ